MSAPDPSSGVSRHLLPQGEKEVSKRDSPSPLEGEGGALAPDEGAVRSKTQFAKLLRRNMTDAEQKLWFMLRDRRFLKFKFRRQVPIGKYVVDFVCQERRLIVEIDGSQHQDSIHDEVRDSWLRSIGYFVLRFWNNAVDQEREGVMSAILDSLDRPLIRRSAPPSPSRGEGKEEKKL
jgi:very-short-patch-repair endonuclease